MDDREPIPEGWVEIDSEQIELLVSTFKNTKIYA